jgi:HD-GYP domain-containing protein (c-di-GMP phosphodiesterase class II)
MEGVWALLCVAVEAAEEGMMLALPVFHPQQPDHVLLQPGFTLTKRVAQRIEHFGVKQVWVKYPSLQRVDKFINLDTLRRRGELATKIGSVFETAQAESFASVDYRTYESTFHDMIATLVANPASALYLDQMAGSDQPLMDHCLRVSYLSVLMGVKLDGYLVKQRSNLSAQRAKQVTNLGLGAMLHDIGKLSLGPEVVERHERTGNDNDPVWQAHVKIGFDMLREKVEATAGAVILHHHQHYDGTGFPKMPNKEGERLPLIGNQIHIFARIACLANEFDRIRHPHEVDALPTVRAMKQLLDPQRLPWFDPRVVEAFLAVVPPYAPGSVVTLNDGRKVTPIDHHPESPCRPTVQAIEVDADALDESFIDLRERDHLHIAHAEGASVAADNFDVPQSLVHAQARIEPA